MTPMKALLWVSGATLVAYVSTSDDIATASRASVERSTQSCLALLVPCNQAHLYSGEITIKTRDSLMTNDDNDLYVEDLKITVDRGNATCTGTRSEREETRYRGVLESTVVSGGPINGPGLLAIEFSRSEGRPVYTMRYACPTATMDSRNTNARTGVSEITVVPAEPADWRREALVADPQPATSQNMPELSGSQTDRRQVPDDAVSGITTTVWQLKRTP